MAALPTATSITGSAVTQSGLRAALNQLVSFLSGLLGDDGVAATARSTLGLTSAAITSVADIGYALLAQGTKMVFHQASAPTGWTQNVAINDKVLRVVSSAGGGAGGSWTISGVTSAVTVTVAAHTLTSGEVPATAVKYTGPVAQDGNAGGGRIYPMRDDTSPGNLTIDMGTVQGGGGSHGHAGSTASATITADGNWRPAYTDVISAAKD